MLAPLAATSIEAGFSTNFAFALFDPFLLTVIEYVFVVVPLAAVTSILIVVVPLAFNAIGDDAAPEVTVVPFTFTVAPESEVTGVTISEVVAWLTEVT